jgi:hypothetical protein
VCVGVCVRDCVSANYRNVLIAKKEVWVWNYWNDTDKESPNWSKKTALLPLFTPKIQHKWTRIEPGLRVCFGSVTCTTVVYITLRLRVSESVSDPLSVRVFGSFLHFVTAVDLSPDGITHWTHPTIPFSGVLDFAHRTNTSKTQH